MNTKEGSAGTAKPAAPRRLSARARLLAAANELFYENGINTVGIDRVIEHAGVAKASLYDCFGSKEELVRSYLEARSLARKQRIQERLAQYDDPADKILSIFDLLGELASQPGYRGCAFVRAGADANAGEKVKSVCDESRAFIQATFTDLCRLLGARDPQLLGRQLVLLYDGAAVSAHMDTNRNAAALARELAARMLVLHNPRNKNF